MTFLRLKARKVGNGQMIYLSAGMDPQTKERLLREIEDAKSQPSRFHSWTMEPPTGKEADRG